MDRIDAIKLYRAIDEYKKLYPVRAELTHDRNLEFSQWIRKYGRPSKKKCNYNGVEIGGYVAFDLDFILHDYANRYMMLLEVKTHNGKVSYSQHKTLSELDKIIRAGANALRQPQYFGLHYLVMDGTTPNNSQLITWNDKVITPQECWVRLNFLDEIFKKKSSDNGNPLSAAFDTPDHLCYTRA